MLKIEEHESKLSEIIEHLKIEGVDQAKLSLLIQDLRENYTETSTLVTKHVEDLTKANDRINSLANANMDLLLRNGNRKQELEELKDDLKSKQNKVKEESKEEILSLDYISSQL